MSKLRLTALCALPLLFANSCTENKEKILKQVPRGVIVYCLESQAGRAEHRAEINAQLAPHGHSIVVTCRGDRAGE